MNIFYVDHSPRLCAEALCDKHLRKLLLETAQMLCTAHHIHGVVDPSEIPYKPTHRNHPCTQWVAGADSAFWWTVGLGIQLGYEYEYRFEKTHKSSAVIEHIYTLPCPSPFGDWMEPPQCMPDEYKCDDTALAYRRYYAESKREICGKYTKRVAPEWLVEMRGEQCKNS